MTENVKHPRYFYKSEKEMLMFEFFSEGPKGTIRKLVEYSETRVANVYNLGFGDYDETTNIINDLSITNNGDSLKVLSTVASTVYAFMEKYPNAWVVATGSTIVRTRLYRMGITNNIVEISEDFVVFGRKGSFWEKFVAGEDYDAFLLTKKNNKFAV